MTKARSNATAPAAKGELVIGTGTDASGILSVGSANQVLTVDSSTATGLKWATPSANAMVQIAAQTVSAVSSVTFSSIPTGYKQIALYWFDVTTSGTTGTDEFSLRLNNDSGTNYNWQRAGIDSAGAGISSTADRNTMGLSFLSNPEPNSGFMYVVNYTDTAKRFFELTYSSASGSTRNRQQYLGYYKGTSAVSEVNVVRTAGSGTFSGTFQLYGLVG